MFHTYSRDMHLLDLANWSCYYPLGWNILGIESMIAWATPGQFSVANFPCEEGGAKCRGDEGESGGSHRTQFYVDPSSDIIAVQRKLREGSHIRV